MNPTIEQIRAANVGIWECPAKPTNEKPDPRFIPVTAYGEVMRQDTYTITEYHPGSQTTSVHTVTAHSVIDAVRQVRPSDPALAVTYLDNHDGTVTVTVSTTAGARYPDSFSYTVHVQKEAA